MADVPPDLSDAFFVRWLSMCQRLECDPVDLIRVAYSESNVRATAHNPQGHASGLIQFMPDTLRGLGFFPALAAEDRAAHFRQLSAEDQVPFVEAYFRPWAFRTGIGGQRIPQLTRPGLCYTATFLPALLGAAVAAGEGAASFVLCGQRGPLAWAYNANKVLDRDGDGSITVGDLETQLATACKGARWDAIVHRLAVAAGVPSEPPPEPPPTEPELPDCGD